MKKNKILRYLVSAVLFAACCGLAIAAKKAVNADKPGEAVDITTYLVRGKTNVVDFYSDYCRPCRKISPLLAKLDQKREDIVVIKIDINREGHRGIDWGSPLARKYGLGSIPHFKIYDPKGKLAHEGRDAGDRVWQMLQALDIQ